MTPLALVVVLLCALAWTGFDIVRKVLVAEVPPTFLVWVVTAAQIPIFWLWNLSRGSEELAAGYWWPALGSILLNLVANAAFAWAIKMSPLSVTIPLLSLTPAFALIVSYVVLGEQPSARQIAGVVAVVFGAFLLATAGHGRVGFRSFFAGLKKEKGAALMILVAVLWACSLPLDKLAISRSGIAVHALVLSAGVAVGLFVVLAARRELGAFRSLRRRPGLILAALVLSATALGLQMLALEVALVSVVETVKRGFGNAAALAIGAWWFHERVVPLQWLAVLLMAAGVGLIVF